ncbi:MAG: glutamate--cysteine ligase, partial [Pseudomonadota bacterium]
VSKTAFSADMRSTFRERLRHETKDLKKLFDDRAFEVADGFDTGLELEAWLVDRNHLPAPEANAFLAAADDHRIVPELSKFNFEINVDPEPLDGAFLTRLRESVELMWRRSETAAQTCGLSPVMTGILPTVRDEMLQPSWMADANRYAALNQELFRLRQDEPLHINIEGVDALDYRCEHIMLEAACTSLQAHLKINQDDAVRFYNASVIASGPLVAASANSPFLYGKSLWAETRIAAFEQSTRVHGFRDSEGRNMLRVTLGSGYLRQSFFELFLENLSYPMLLPALSDDNRYAHLRLQNGTIWRWNRPILGFGANGAPHLRIEQRVMPAGPSIVDSVANLALYFGLALALARQETPPEQAISFEDARANFYACAKDGLHARLRWAGEDVDVQGLLLKELVPLAKTALIDAGADRTDCDYYFDDILHRRLLSGLNGAQWQRDFIDCKGVNYQALTERYVEWQATGAPVHTWTV